MSNENTCTEAIYSENVVDYIIDYAGDLEVIKEEFSAICAQKLQERGRFIMLYSSLETAWPADVVTKRYRTIPKLYGTMDTSSLEDLGIYKLRRLPYLDLYGQGTLVGIVDTGIDYRNPLFINANNTSRIRAIWDQTRREGPMPEGFLYGTEYTNEQINQALSSETPETIVPTTDEVGHGTFLAAIAAGNIDETNDFSGIAPQAEIMVVKLKPAKNYLKEFFRITSDQPAFQENDIMLAIEYLRLRALQLRKPLAICIGLGTSSGDHQGGAPISSYINSISNQQGLCICAASGNEGNTGHHFGGRVTFNEYQDVELKVGENQRELSLEMWSVLPNLFSIALISPSGEIRERIPAKENTSVQLSFVLEPTVITVAYSISDASTGNELIFMQFSDLVPGIWRIRVYNETDIGEEYHIWLPINNYVENDTYFLSPDPNITLVETGTTNRSIVLGAYNHKENSIYIASSRGYTLQNQVKPDVTGAGVNIYGPVSRVAFGELSGSSISAAHGTGTAALLLQWGIVEGKRPTLNTTEIKSLFIKGADRASREYPNPEWGYGILNAYSAFESARTTI